MQLQTTIFLNETHLSLDGIISYLMQYASQVLLVFERHNFTETSIYPAFSCL